MGMQETRDMRLVRTTRGTAVAMAFLLGACAAQKQVPAPMMEPVWDGTEEVSDLLAESAQRAVSAHETLAMIERTRDQPAPSPLDETTLPPELQRATSIDRKSVGWGKSVSESVDLGGRRYIKKKKTKAR